MKQREFEELLLRQRFSDEEFAQYLQENPLQEVEFEVEDAEVAIEKKEFTLLESSVLEYIEELCSYDPERLIEEREAHIALEMKKVLYYAFFYLKEGISYMDLVQEGIIGLMKGVDRDSEALDFWIIRELFFFVYAQIQDVKFGFKNFLKGKEKKRNISTSTNIIMKKDMNAAAGIIQMRNTNVVGNIIRRKRKKF
ncbi:hypothetical protein HMPREF9466_02917 [Fusobacterium necrophorum subsp. funduliforme 1_1_36S]|nr:hypothetical protein HMPREF9466_02917 [Fusobacterium necrophorum subsp. funduliforme 1_1_36S]